MTAWLALVLALALALAAPAQAAAAIKGPTMDEWRQRVVYQILTDRFASPNLLPAAGGDARCWKLQGYCGGTWRGAVDQLAYIKVRHPRRQARQPGNLSVGDTRLRVERKP